MYAELKNTSNQTLGGIKHPRLWPSTLPWEDEVRAKGHIVYTRFDYLWFRY